MEAILIQSPHPDLTTFLAGANKLLGRTISTQVDKSKMSLTDAEKFRLCLLELLGWGGPEVGVVLHHLHYSVLLYAYTDDLLAILTICNMPFVSCQTTVRGVDAAVVTGSAAEWKTAIESCSQEYKSLFEKIGSFIR